MSSALDLTAALPAAHAAIDLAVEHVFSHPPRHIRYQGDRNPVSEVDDTIEHLVRQRLSAPVGASSPAPPRAVPGGGRRRRGGAFDRALPYLLLAPALIAILRLIGFPAVSVVLTSFRKPDLGYSLAVVIPSFYAFYLSGLSSLMPGRFTPIVLLVVGGLLTSAGGGRRRRCPATAAPARRRHWPRAHRYRRSGCR